MDINWFALITSFGLGVAILIGGMVIIELISEFAGGFKDVEEETYEDNSTIK